MALGTVLAMAAGPTAPVKVAALSLPPQTQSQTRTDGMVDRVSKAWFKTEWTAFADRFVTPEGRVVDNANGRVSHSEGQGYGLLLAARADDAARFQAIWSWTEAHLMVRADGLAAWKWDPKTGAVADTNNATDGDILIAWALWDGAKRFGRADYRKAAERIARAIAGEVVATGPAGPVLLPGTKGFAAGEQNDGPVVNLSYWVFPAFPALNELAPDTDWNAVWRNGMALLERSRFGPFGLPTEWESVAGREPRPASAFPAEFGYNALRIPLYLALEGGDASKAALHRFTGAWTRGASASNLLDIKAAAIRPPLAAPGYSLVLALARCVAAGEAIPPEAINTRSDLYYPETLRLLSVVAIQERFPACL